MESTPGQSFLSPDGNDASEYDIDFAALDSMDFPAPGRDADPGDGRENGFAGVSGSLFDRIRARAAEQQQQSTTMQQQQQQQQQYRQPQQQHEYAFVSQQQPSAFASQQQRAQQEQQQPRQEVQHHSGEIFAPVHHDAGSTTTTAYSYASGIGEGGYGGGEDYSSRVVHPNDAIPRVPVYGASRPNDPSSHAYAPLGGMGGHGGGGGAGATIVRAGEALTSVLTAGFGMLGAIGTKARNGIVGGGGGEEEAPAAAVVGEGTMPASCCGRTTDRGVDTAASAVYPSRPPTGEARRTRRRIECDRPRPRDRRRRRRTGTGHRR
jgi:hypothetical protein